MANQLDTEQDRRWNLKATSNGLRQQSVARQAVFYQVCCYVEH